MATNRYLAAGGSGNGLTILAPANWPNDWLTQQTGAGDGGTCRLIRPANGSPLPMPAAILTHNKRMTIEGIDSTGAPTVVAIRDDRAWPWPANGAWKNTVTGFGDQYVAAEQGGALFSFKTGASRSVYRNLRFEHMGTPVTAGLTNGWDVDALGFEGFVTVTFENCESFNTSYGLIDGDSPADGVIAVIAKDCYCTHYSIMGIRTWGSIRRTDCVFDARNQFHTPTTGLAGTHLHDFAPGAMSLRPTQIDVRCTDLNHAPVMPADTKKVLTVNGTGGTYTGTFKNQTITSLQPGYTAAQLQTALETLSNISPGDIAVTGGPGGSSPTPYLIQFLTGNVNDIGAITFSKGGLTGGNGTVTFTPSGYTQADAGVREDATRYGYKRHCVMKYSVDRLDDSKSPVTIEDSVMLYGGIAVSQHNDGARTIVRRSHIGKPMRRQAYFDNVVLIQAAGRIEAHSVSMDLTPADPLDPQPPNLALYSVFRGETNDAGYQSNGMNPIRNGAGLARYCRIKRATGTVESSGIVSSASNNGRTAFVFGLAAGSVARRGALSADLANNATTLSLSAPISAAPATDYAIMIEQEALLVTGGHQTSTLTVTRAYAGTSQPGSSQNNKHASGVAVALGHSLTVKSVNAAGVEGAAGSPTVFVTADAYTHGDLTPPAAPGTPVASSITNTSVTLTWSAPATDPDGLGVYAYVVFINGVSSYASQAIDSNGNPQAVTISNLVPGTAYTFTVVAYDCANNVSSQSSPAWDGVSAAGKVTTTGTPSAPAAPPTGPKPTVSGFGASNAVITWGSTAGTTVGYRLYDALAIASPTLIAEKKVGLAVTPVWTPPQHCITTLV